MTATAVEMARVANAESINATKVCPKLGPVWVLVEPVLSIGENWMVRIEGTSKTLLVDSQKLKAGLSGTCLSGLLVEHQCESGQFFGQRYSGKVVIDRQTFEVPATALVG